jgi:hypothetical protein
MNKITLTAFIGFIFPATTLLAQSVYPANTSPPKACKNTSIGYPKPVLKKRAFAFQDTNDTFAFSIANNHSLNIITFEKGPRICDPYFNLESPVQNGADSILGNEIVPAEETFAFNYSKVASNYPALLVSSFYLSVDESNCAVKFWTNDYRNLESAIEYLESRYQSSAVGEKMLLLFKNVQSNIPDDITQVIYQARQ